MKIKTAFSTMVSFALLLSLLVAPAHAVSNFSDVPADAYYANAVDWAVEQKITSGTSATTFSPDSTCTRAQILTFIWRANGSPEPELEKISTANHNPFPDLNGTEYYFKAAQWAYTQGMVAGGMNFNGNEPCSRSLAVTYIWEAAGEPIPAKEASFTDIIRALHNMNAISWAVEVGVTSGTSATTFSPDTTCTRGQIVTFLYRANEAVGTLNNNSDNTGNDNDYDSTGDVTGSVWDQAFYDTLTPEQQERYRNADDVGRQTMKGVIEASRELENQGYEGSGENSWEHDLEAWQGIS